LKSLPGALTITNLTLTVRRANARALQILELPSLACRFDERIGVMGKNGAGKSSLARLLAGLDRPTSGRINKNPPRSRLLLVLQRPEDLFVRATVGAQIASYVQGAVDPAKIRTLITSVGLPLDAEQVSPLTLSTGQQRLVAIACALAAGPDMIIMDEPMAGLDYLARENVRQALVRLKQETSHGWIVISHHPDDLLGLVDRLWLIDQGRITYDGSFASTPSNLLSACLSEHETSWYWLLRKMQLNDSNYYTQLDVPRLVALLRPERAP
jgi:ABC-type multidrug transport system ATPase subunit